MPLFPVTTIIGALAVLAIIISTWWVEGMRPTMESGIPWLLMLSAIVCSIAAAESKRYNVDIFKEIVILSGGSAHPQRLSS